LVLGLGEFGVDTNAKEGYRQSTEHPETDPGERVPTQVYRAQANGKGPEQCCDLENVKHELAFHNLPSILEGLSATGDKKQGVE